MKKVLLPLLMLIAIAGLLAVESSPSAIVGYVKYPCVSGLNLVAFPMGPGIASSDEFTAAYGSAITTVNTWMSDIQDWYGIDYGPFGWTDEIVLTPGAVALVNSADVYNLYSMGTVPTPPTYNLVEGLNTVMVPLNRSDCSTIAAFGDAFGGNVTTLNKWLNDIQDWYGVDYGPFGWTDTDTPAAIGDPFLVNSSVVFTWPTGAKGAQTLKTSRASK